MHACTPTRKRRRRMMQPAPAPALHGEFDVRGWAQQHHPSYIFVSGSQPPASADRPWEDGRWPVVPPLHRTTSYNSSEIGACTYIPTSFSCTCSLFATMIFVFTLNIKEMVRKSSRQSKTNTVYASFPSVSSASWDLFRFYGRKILTEWERKTVKNFPFELKDEVRLFDTWCLVVKARPCSNHAPFRRFPFLKEKGCRGPWETRFHCS